MSSNDSKPQKLKNKVYQQELARLQVELVKLQEFIKARGLKVVVVFEGRDAAGKGGTIKRVTNASTRASVALWLLGRSDIGYILVFLCQLTSHCGSLGIMSRLLTVKLANPPPAL